MRNNRTLRKRHRGLPSNQRGAVTAEFAIVLPALTAILGLVLAGAVAGGTQLRLEEAARAGAREIARGQTDGSAAATVARIAGAKASVLISREGGWSVVRVSSGIQAPLLGLLDLRLQASAQFRSEPGPYGPADGR